MYFLDTLKSVASLFRRSWYQINYLNVDEKTPMVIKRFCVRNVECCQVSNLTTKEKYLTHGIECI